MRLSIHILRVHLGPFLFSFSTLMFIFLLQFLMKFIDQLVGKGLGAWVISELIGLSLAWMVVLAVPMSILVATLMGFGSLSAHNEITAMKAGGMSLYRMMAPVLLASAIITYLLLEFNNNVLPDANHRLKVLMTDIRRIKPTLTIMPGLFSQDIPGYSILARRTFEHSNDLEGVTLFDYTNPATNVVVTAERGRVSFTPDYKKLIMDLENGEIHEISVNEMQAYRKMRYAQHRIIMNAEGFDFERSNESAFSRGDRELSAAEMIAIVDSLDNTVVAAAQHAFQLLRYQGMVGYSRPAPAFVPDPIVAHQTAVLLALNKARTDAGLIENQLVTIEYNQTQINQYLVEIHKKYAIPAACLVFVFIGAPLGIMARRGTFGIAATLSLGFFLLYWASLIGGEKLADRGFVSPWLGMWFANIVLGIVGIYLTIRLGRETPAIHWPAFRKLIPVAFRSPAPTDFE